MDYKDDEMIELRNKFILGVAIFLVVAIPFLLLLSNKLIMKKTKIEKMIDKKESMFILVCSEDKTSCKNINKYLKENKVAHNILYETDKNYGKIINKLGTYKPEVITPSIIVVVEGETFTILNSVEINEELDMFLENYVDRND